MMMEQDPRFHASLEDCSRRVLGGESLERCLNDYPAEFKEELSRLVPLAAAIGRLGSDPSPGFRARLRRHVAVWADGAKASQSRGLHGLLRGLFYSGGVTRFASVAVIALLLLSGGGFGAVQASARSLPDSPLYQVKTAREWVQTVMARDADSQADVVATSIQERGREVERALRAGKQERVIEQVLTQLSSSVKQMDDRALEANARGNSRPITLALATISSMRQRIDRLTPRASPSVRRLLQRIDAFLDQEESRLLRDSGRSVLRWSHSGWDADV